VIYITPWSIRYLRRIGLNVKDQNKKGKPLVPISGGMAVLSGLFVGLMLFIFLQTFFPDGIILKDKSLVYLLSGLISIIMITFIGFIDDLMIRDDREVSLGLRQWQKPLLTFTAAIPLMVVHAGVSTLILPFFGRVDMGLIYPLLLIPLGVIGAANMVNLLAGFNGLETGMGVVYVGMLTLYAYVNREGLFMVERTSAVILGSIVFAALIAFYLFNKSPAKILPGDSLTYLLGGVLATMAIIGNLEKAALICSIPFFIEFILKLRGKLKKQSYGYYDNGKVRSLYKKIYSLPHILTITGKFTEKQITYTFILMELFFSSLIWVI
jgi:UDP-N-acetylglucosamine--dolichyl-phosphate N-acetylglucosaminephosphotransferase